MRSRWRMQKNGLPQGSVRSPILFNIYTNDQPIHDGTRNFIYADDICVTAQYSSFTEVETTIGDALDKLTQYYRSNSLAGIAPPDIRSDVCARMEKTKQETNEAHSLYGQNPAEKGLKSRNCFLHSVKSADFPPKGFDVAHGLGDYKQYHTESLST